MHKNLSKFFHNLTSERDDVTHVTQTIEHIIQVADRSHYKLSQKSIIHLEWNLIT